MKTKRLSKVTTHDTKALDDGIEFIISTDSVDRDGDIITQDFDTTDFMKNPIALFGHRHDKPIGTWENIKVSASQTTAVLKLAAEGTSDFIDGIRSLVEQKILNAVSIGFRAGEYTWMDETDGYRLSKNKLFEISLVSVPANQDAIRISKSLCLPKEVTSECFIVDGKKTCKSIDGHVDFKRASESTTVTKKIKKDNPMTIAQRIKMTQEKINSAKDELALISAKDELEDSEVEKMALLTDDITANEKQLSTFEATEKQLMMSATPASKQTDEKGMNPYGSTQVHEKKREKGSLFFAAAAAIAKAQIEKSNPLDVAKSLYKDQSDIHTMVKAASAPAMTNVSGWAEELVQTGYGEFLELLRPETVYGRLPGMHLTFDRYGELVIPAASGAGKLAGGFVAEGAPIPVKQTSFTSQTLKPKEMGVITTFSDKLARHSTPAIESILRTQMLADTAEAIDKAFLDNGAASAIRPAGLQDPTATGAANIKASAGATVADVLTDIKGVLGRLSALNMGNTGGMWLMNPAQKLGLSMMQLATGTLAFPEVNNGVFAGFGIITSNTVPAGTVFFVDAQAMAYATDYAPTIVGSSVAALHMEDTTPAEIVDAAGAAAKPVRSLFQTNTSALRLTLGMDWSLVRQGGVQVLTGVAW